MSSLTHHAPMPLPALLAAEMVALYVMVLRSTPLRPISSNSFSVRCTADLV